MKDLTFCGESDAGILKNNQKEPQTYADNNTNSPIPRTLILSPVFSIRDSFDIKIPSGKFKRLIKA
jgi:hypothetical protein